MVIFCLHLRGGLEINTFAPEKLDPVPGRRETNNTHGQMVTLCSGSAVIITPPVLIIL